MMYSLVILMFGSLFACGYPKKSFGYLIFIVGSGLLKTLLHCSFNSSLIFLLLGSGSPLRFSAICSDTVSLESVTVSHGGWLSFCICGLGDWNSANIYPFACGKRGLIMGYKLSYTTVLLYALSSCMK